MKHNSHIVRPTFILFASCMLLSGCFGKYAVYSAKTQPPSNVKGGMLYALPRTEICIDVQFAYRDTSGIPFAEFAEEMLAYDNSKARYTIEGITLSTRIKADPDRYYFVNPKGVTLQIDQRNLLRSIGMDESECIPSVNSQHKDIPNNNNQTTSYNLYDRTDTFYVRGDRPGHPTLASSRKDSRSLRQRAEDAAERIGDLQERRLQLLEGESDEHYSAETLQLMLQQIDRQEATLTQQFIGKQTTETVRFVVEPKDEKNLIDNQTIVVFYYSPAKGITDSTDTEAVPVSCNIRCIDNMKNATRFIRYRLEHNKNPDKSRLFKYRRSEMADVIVYSDLFRYQQQLPVAQFGPIIELPKGKFKARFDEKTGDLIYFSN